MCFRVAAGAGVSLEAWTEVTLNNFSTKVVHLALWMEQFDGYVVEGAAGVGAGDVGEVAGGVAELAVGQYQVDFGSALDGVDDVGGAERNVKIGNGVRAKTG